MVVIGCIGLVFVFAVTLGWLVLRLRDARKSAVQLEHRFWEESSAHGRVKRALTDSENQLRQTQKMESLGMLAGGIAHDFNNLLSVISTNTSMLADAVSPNDREMIEDIEATVIRAVDLTRQLLMFSRKQVTAPRVVDLNEVVTETRRLLRRMIGKDVKLETSLEPDLDPVFIDPSSFVQVLMNLAVNARDAMPTGGALTIATRRSAGSVVIIVSDTGCGIASEVLARVFEPFFTTKEVGKGTGMGLAVAHGIIRQASGQIAVTSKLGVGTTFTISLPAVAAEPELEHTRARRATVPHGVETLLVVDDDAFVLRSAGRVLRSHGYKVIEVTSPMAALRALDKGPVDLLLTDLMMPQMNGHELAEIAAAAHPTLKILYMSGCVDDTVVRHGVEREEVQLIEKPFKSHSLAVKVRKVLDAHPPA